MIKAQQVDYFFDVCSEDVDKIKKAIGEDEERLQHVEQLVHQWIEYEQHLPKNYDGGMVRNFVRGAKFNLETSKRKLEAYFFAKYTYPGFYQDRIPYSDDILKACEFVDIVRLPRLTEDGERICVVGMVKRDGDVEEDFDMVTAIKLFFMLYDLSLTCTFPTQAEVLVFDTANVPSRVLAQCLTPSFMNAIALLRRAYAARISQLHIVNCPAMAEKLVAAVRPLLHEKVRRRFVVHKNHESLREYLHPELLPLDYGGKLGSLRSFMKQWMEILRENADWFQEQESVKILGKPPNTMNKLADDFGVEGSFRQLSVD